MFSMVAYWLPNKLAIDEILFNPSNHECVKMCCNHCLQARLTQYLTIDNLHIDRKFGEEMNLSLPIIS